MAALTCAISAKPRDRCAGKTFAPAVTAFPPELESTLGLPEFGTRWLPPRAGILHRETPDPADPRDPSPGAQAAAMATGPP
jgi:hypothetical protein